MGRLASPIFGVPVNLGEAKMLLVDLLLVGFSKVVVSIYGSSAWQNRAFSFSPLWRLIEA